MAHHNFRVLLACVAAAGWLTPTPSEAAVFACGSGDVGCLVAAINQANANGKTNTITLAEGVYTLTSIDNAADGPTGLPVVTGRLSIIGAGSEVTIVERAADAPSFRIVDVAASGELTLRRVTLRHGDDGGGLLLGYGIKGAGVFASGIVKVIDSVVTENNSTGSPSMRGIGGGVAGGTVELIRSTISHNRAQAGAGVYIEPGGSLTVKQSTIAQNLGFGGGGGVWFASEGRLAMEDSLVDRNAAGYTGPEGGGGLYIGGGNYGVGSIGGALVTIRHSTISHNTGAYYGGGINVDAPDSTVVISHSTIADNNGVTEGGGISVVRGTLTVIESTVARNTSLLWAAAFLVRGNPAQVTVRNSTIVGNQNTYVGASAFFSTLDTTLENTILALNSPSSSTCYPFTSLGHNVIGDSVPCVPLQGTDLTGDPGLGAYIDPGRPGTGHYPLLAGSPAIDTGDDDGCGRTDQLGLPRPVRGRDCDIGAIEFYPIVNDLVWLEHMRSDYVPPDPDHVNPLALGGEYRIEAVFRNGGSESICQVAFEAATLTQDGSPTPALLTERGELIGRQGIVWPATLAGGSDSLRVRDRERYHFRIGVNIAAPITFELNVLGKVGRCKANHHGEGREDDR